MDEDEMADAIAYYLNKDSWKAEIELWNVINFTNEHGEKFTVTVEKVEENEED